MTQEKLPHRKELCLQSETPSHMCEGVFLVVATRFELATSASRTQRSTKLSHTSMLSLFFKREEYSINILRRKCYGTAS